MHVLAADQEHLSSRFASRGSDTFAGVASHDGPGGVPMLDGCAARFVCRAPFEYEGGDHAIFVGQVIDLLLASATPLIFHGGRYGRVMPGEARSALIARAARGGIDLPQEPIDRIVVHGEVAADGNALHLTPRGRRTLTELTTVAQAAQLEPDARFSPQEMALSHSLLERLAAPRWPLCVPISSQDITITMSRRAIGVPRKRVRY